MFDDDGRWSLTPFAMETKSINKKRHRNIQHKFNANFARACNVNKGQKTV